MRLCLNETRKKKMLDRYSRQTLFAPIGKEGQERLRAATVTIIGCGALGTVLANNLCRAGIGRLVIADRDYIELNNLQRQILFDEDDIARRLPKAIAAAVFFRKCHCPALPLPVIQQAYSTALWERLRVSHPPRLSSCC